MAVHDIVHLAPLSLTPAVAGIHAITEGVIMRDRSSFSASLATPHPPMPSSRPMPRFPELHRPVAEPLPHRAQRATSTGSAAPGTGGEEPEYRVVESYLAVEPLIAALTEQERRVPVTQFFEFRTRTEIAEEFDGTQMQVSRILSRMLYTLREQALRDRATGARGSGLRLCARH